GHSVAPETGERVVVVIVTRSLVLSALVVGGCVEASCSEKRKNLCEVLLAARPARHKQNMGRLFIDTDGVSGEGATPAVDSDDINSVGNCEGSRSTHRYLPRLAMRLTSGVG